MNPPQVPALRESIEYRPQTAPFRILSRPSSRQEAWKGRSGCSVDGLRAEVNLAMKKCFQTSRPNSAADFSVDYTFEPNPSRVVKSADDEILAKDLLIADLQDEIQDLQRMFQEQVEQQSKVLATTEAKNRALSEKVREVEKQSSILRSAILSGQLQSQSNSAQPQTESTRAIRIAGEQARSTELFEAGCSDGVVSSSKAGPDPRTLLLHRA
eukprot:CAMPEP_0172173768 /NCGR_PEP_ID=MMETSP1050-20130122/13268_1 /TAXON_ID=233186 /ORGANISM="Cryptomonas curvata, Strain CCAP979/52" /LENGTH=211 /DNA_ID=CAMNT_0012845621 /DNA_START=102 /DNA_END=733 /DNA_ORIENTATION=+